MTDLARSTWSQRPALEPLPRDLEAFVLLAEKGKLKGQLASGMGVIDDVGAFVTSYALLYLCNRDADRALECLQAAAEAYRKSSVRAEPTETPESKAPKTYPIPEGATFRPCRSCRTPITFIKTETGSSLPITREGVSHYTNCDDPKRFSKGAK